MKTIREIINTHSIEKNEDILQDMVDELYTYVEYRENLKVIEELERIPNLKTPLGEEIRLSYHYVLKRIKELNQ